MNLFSFSQKKTRLRNLYVGDRQTDYCVTNPCGDKTIEIRARRVAKVSNFFFCSLNYSVPPRGFLIYNAESEKIAERVAWKLESNPHGLQLDRAIDPTQPH